MNRFAFLSAIMASPAFADQQGYYGYGHMDGYGYGIGMMFGPVLWLIVIGLIIAGVIWMVRRSEPASASGKPSGALAELDLRFARGEIDADDYAARKKLLTAS